ncbi:MAG: M23 family metallopeptidase [Patescibacteria group bacterium]|nr:M23 family metallopeptidase [Patescibacteria group bacterium]MCL5432166.1 M23 family metallopeptidase [Patescibacteria group bacterium]
MKTLLAFIFSILSAFSPKPTIAPIPAPAFYYPITNYASRLQLRPFGQYISTTDQKTVVCGAAFVGWHTGDDLETTPAEKDSPAPVYSIAAGKILQVSAVSGYGGLIVAAYTLAGQDVTAYYGHVNLTSALAAPGDNVAAGQKLADLGAACSAQTDGERKHLHFAIHKGPTIDVRGYVSTQSELSNWLNPALELAKLGAHQI